MSNSNYLNEDHVLSSINRVIQEEIDKAFDAAIEKAKEDLDKELRKEIAKTVMRLHSYFSVEWRGQEIIIKIQNDT